MNCHPYARAIPSAFYSNTQGIINANRRNPDDSIMPIPFTEMRGKSSRNLLTSERNPPSILIQYKMTPRPSGKVVLEGEGVELILGGQEEYTKTPSYGRCAVVDGVLKLDNPRDVLKVEAKLIGHISVRELAGNGSAKTPVLSEQLVFWDSPPRASSLLRQQRHQHQAPSSSRDPTFLSASTSALKSAFTAPEHCPASLSFRTTFPSHYIDGSGERMPLPPSFSDKLSSIPGFRVGVNYAITVAVTRHREQKPKQRVNLGFNMPWKSKTRNVLLEEPVEYMPRSKPSRSPMFPVNSKPSNQTPRKCFPGLIESRDARVQPLRTEVKLLTAQLVPLTGSIPFFIRVMGSEETIRPLVRGAPVLPSFLPMESPSTDSLASFASSVLPSPIVRQFPCLNVAMDTAISSTSSFSLIGNSHYRRTNESPSPSRLEDGSRRSGPNVRVIIVREVTVDARSAGIGLESPLDDILESGSNTPDSGFFDLPCEKRTRSGSSICKTTVIGEGVVYSTSSIESSHPGCASWAGEVRIDPRLGIRTGGFKTRALSVKDMLIVSISQFNVGRTTLQDFRQVIPLQFTTDGYSDD